MIELIKLKWELKKFYEREYTNSNYSSVITALMVIDAIITDVEKRITELSEQSLSEAGYF